MFHNSTAVLAISKEPNPTKFQKTLGVNDFYFGMPGFEYPMGNIQMVGKSSAPMFRARSRSRPSSPRRSRLDEVAKHAVDFWLSTEDLPRPDNRVTLAQDGNVTLTYTFNNQEPKKQLYNKLKSMLGHLGMHPDHLLPRTAYLKNEIPIAGVAHQAGTVRFGTDPATSVLDVNCKAHELDNLYVVDTSFFPSIGAVNPALTAIANSLRVGDHLLERLGASAGRPRAGRRRRQRQPMSGRRWWLGMASRREVGAVYGAGLVQGVALVTFPAASSILTSPDYYGLSSTAYGALFLPQAVAAILAALAGASLTRRWAQADVPGRAGRRRRRRCRCWSPASSPSARVRFRTRCCCWRRPAWASASG